MKGGQRRKRRVSAAGGRCWGADAPGWGSRTLPRAVLGGQNRGSPGPRPRPESPPLVSGMTFSNFHTWCFSGTPGFVGIPSPPMHTGNEPSHTCRIGVGNAGSTEGTSFLGVLRPLGETARTSAFSVEAHRQEQGSGGQLVPSNHCAH